MGGLRSTSALGPKELAETDPQKANLSRAAWIEQLRQQYTELQKTFPEGDLGEFFSRRRRDLNQQLQRAKRNKYNMVMPRFMAKATVELGALGKEPEEPKKVSPVESPSPKRKATKVPTSGLPAVVSSVCLELANQSGKEDPAPGVPVVDKCRGLCFFAPRLEGGPVKLVEEVRRYYKDSQRQAGAFLFASTLLQIATERYDRDDKEAVVAAIQAFASKDMTAVHRHGLYPTNLQSRRLYPSGSGSLQKARSRKAIALTGPVVDFMDVDVKQLADALVVIDYENLARVSLDDLLFHRWEVGKREEPESGKPTKVFHCVKRWVHLGDWVASEIVCTGGLKQ